MLQFASFDTSFWKGPSFTKDSNIPTQIFKSREVHVTCLHTCQRRKWHPSSHLPHRSLLCETYPSLDLRPPEISLISPHQGATFKPQHSSHGNHDSWQSSHHEFSTVKREIEKNEQPQKQGQICKTLIPTYPWGLLRCLKRFLQRFQDLLRCLWDVPCKKPSGWNRNVDWWWFLYVFRGIAPRCSTSSPTSLLFVVSGAVRLATWKNRTLQWPGSHSWMSRKSTFTSHHISGLPHWSQPKGSSNFCSVTRLQWFTLITRS